MNTLFYISKSPIHGYGVFAKAYLESNTNVGRVTNPYPKVTAMGKRINHSYEPNCRLSYYDDRHELLTIQDIKEGEELTVDYDFCPGFIGTDVTWPQSHKKENDRL